jgi:putative membrane protein
VKRAARNTRKPSTTRTNPPWRLREAVGRHNLSAMHSLVVPLVHLLLTGASVLIVAKILPGITVKSYKAAVLFALVVAIFNAIAWTFLWPVSWGFTLLTLGLGMLVINGLVFLVSAKVVEGVQISGCMTAAFASLGVSLVNWAMHFVFGKWAP